MLSDYNSPSQPIVSNLPLICFSEHGVLMDFNSCAETFFALISLRKDRKFDVSKENAKQFDNWLSQVFAGQNAISPPFTLNNTNKLAFTFKPLEIKQINQTRILLALAQDVSDLYENALLLEMLCDNFDGFLYAKDHNNRFITLNSAYAKELNCSKTQAKNHTERELRGGYGSEIDFSESEEEQILDDGRPRTVPLESFTSKKTGTKHTLETTRKRATLFGSRIIIGSSINVSKFETQWEHTDALFDIIFSYNNEEQILAKSLRIAKQVAHHAWHQIGDKKDDGSQAIAVIRHHPGNSSFNILASFPESFYDAKQKQWDDDERKSIAGYVIKNGSYANESISDMEKLQPVHEDIVAVACVPIRHERERTKSQSDHLKSQPAHWGVLSFVSKQSCHKHDIEITKRILERYAEQISNALIVSNMLVRDRMATTRFLSCLMEGHELRTLIQHASNNWGMVREIIEEMPIAERLAYYESVYGGKWESFRQYFTTASLDLTSSLRRVGQWKDLANHLSKFMKCREESGIKKAIMETLKSLQPTLLNIQNIINEEIADIRKVTSKLFRLNKNRNERRCTLIKLDEVIVRAALQNLLANSYIHSGEHNVEPIDVEYFVNKECTRLFIKVTNCVELNENSLHKIEFVQQFFKRGEVSPLDCPGWGTAIISFAQTLYNGMVGVKLSEDKKKLTVRLVLTNQQI